MKRAIIGAIILIALGLGWIVHSRVRRSRQQMADAAVMAPLQHDLPVGTPRDVVKRYLDSRGINFGEVDQQSRLHPVGSYAVSLGPRSVDIFCDWNAFIVFDFQSSGNSKRTITDSLSGIRSKRPTELPLVSDFE